MADYDEPYISDNESYEYEDDDITGGKAEESEDELLIAPADPDEGLDDSDTEYFDESDPEDNKDDDDAPPADADEYESDDESLDLKKVSNYNKEIIIVKPENRRTSHIISKFEMTEIVSIRATQISQHNNCMVDITGLDDPIKMAKRELMMRKCPLVLRRHVGELRDSSGEPRTYYEYWCPNQMIFSTTYMDVL